MEHRLEHPKASCYPLNKSTSLFWVQSAWKHVELGAANYAQNVDGDCTHHSFGELSSKQFDILFKTVDALIQDKGCNGIIYINDLEEKMVQFTMDQLNNYLLKHYPSHAILVKPLVGDFFKINLPHATTIHLKNPECWFFDNLKRIENQHRLAYFANHASEGLLLCTYFKKEFYEQLEHLNIGYKILNTNFQPYIHADGEVITTHGKVIQFCIKSLETLRKEESTEFVLHANANTQAFSAKL